MLNSTVETLQTQHNPWAPIYSDFRHKVVREAVVEGVETFDGKLCLLINLDKEIKGFIPEEEADLRNNQKLIDLVGRKVYYEVMFIDRTSNVVILSRKKGNERRADITWNTIDVGQVRKGVVVKVAQKHLVILCDGIITLLPFSELSHGYVDNPGQKYKPGTELEVKVIKVRRPDQPKEQLTDKGDIESDDDLDDGDNDTALAITPRRGRVEVSLKALLPDPWLEVPYRYKIGGIYRGRVQTEADKSLFTTLEEGVDVRTDHAKFGNPPIGTWVLVKITAIDTERRRINGRLVKILSR